MPSKSRNYGLKIFWASESSTGYALNAITYSGKEGDQVHQNLGQDIVLRLLEPYYGTGRDVCTDNFFTSYNLTKLLLEEFNYIRNNKKSLQRNSTFLELKLNLLKNPVDLFNPIGWKILGRFS